MPVDEDSRLGNSLTGQAALLTELMSSAITPLLRQKGITHVTFNLLGTIHAAGPDATQSEIGERLGVSPATLTEALQGAASRGLVSQEAHPGDKRAKRVRLTPKGRKVLNEIVTRVNSLEEGMVENIGADDLALASSILRRAIGNLARKSRDLSTEES